MWARRTNKFKARKTVCPSKGHPHPSALEASVCEILTLREKAHDIEDVKWIATVRLPFGIKWKVDFSFTECSTKQKAWAEAKGKETSDYVVKVTMWRNGAGPGKLEIWKGSYKKPFLIETIIPTAEKTQSL